MNQDAKRAQENGNGNRHKAITIAPARLPYHPSLEERFGVGQAEWRALVDAIFPLAKDSESIILALSYCRARKLDPFKRVVHIVPMWNSELGRMVETVWPGIGELRTTAFRTRQYAGRDNAAFGPTITKTIGKTELEFPEWCQITAYRVLDGQKYPFPGPRVYWLESYAMAKKDDPTPNHMWRKRPFGQLDKCAEAAALRAAFPEEIGNDHIAEEMEGRTLGVDSPRAAIASRQTLKDKLDALAAGGEVSDETQGLLSKNRDPAHDPDTGEVITEEIAAAAQAKTEEANSVQTSEVEKIGAYEHRPVNAPLDLGMQRLLDDARAKTKEGALKLKYWVARLNQKHFEQIQPYLEDLRAEANAADAAGGGA